MKILITGAAFYGKQMHVEIASMPSALSQS